MLQQKTINNNTEPKNNQLNDKIRMQANYGAHPRHQKSDNACVGNQITRNSSKYNRINSDNVHGDCKNRFHNSTVLFIN